VANPNEQREFTEFIFFFTAGIYATGGVIKLRCTSLWLRLRPLPYQNALQLRKLKGKTKQLTEKLWDKNKAEAKDAAAVAGTVVVAIGHPAEPRAAVTTAATTHAARTA